MASAAVSHIDQVLAASDGDDTVAVSEVIRDSWQRSALAYHVDYWNYLGWNDTMASKDNTARQYAYARTMGRSGVYTPQAIVNGRDHMNGADLGAINVKLDDFQRGGEGLTVPPEGPGFARGSPLSPPQPRPTRFREIARPL